MKTGKKIAVALAAALAVAIFAGAAVSMVGAQFTEELPPFTVTVSAFDVGIVINETDFGEVIPGQEKEIHTFNVFNTGIITALVEARFTTDEDGTYGLTGGSVISAENFMLSDVALNNDGTDKYIFTAPISPPLTIVHARLFVPIGQPDSVYSGTVELTISPTVPA